MKLTGKYGMMVAAHRGDYYHSFENTMEAFRRALDQGADMIETDIRMTGDGHLVLMHDASCFRTTGMDSLVSDMTLEEVLQLNAGCDAQCHRVPTLEEFLSWAKPTELTLNLELKEYYVPGNEDRCRECTDKVVEMVERFDLSDRIILNSFDAWVLEYADEAYGGKYLLHGFYPYTAMKNVNRNPDEYLFCACISGCTKDKRSYDHLLRVGIEPWVGASFTSKPMLDFACRCGATLVTTNNTPDTITKLKELGKR